jgi:hypothetical protein
MKIKVRPIKETPDGGGVCEIEYDAEGHELLIQYGLNALFKEALNIEKINRLNAGFDAHNTWPFQHDKKSPKKKVVKHDTKK